MSKIKSMDDLLDRIDDEYTWRFQEIDRIKSLLQQKKGKPKYEQPLSKALVALSYSHWEGFVKYSAEYFFEYIRFLGLPRKELSDKFLASCILHLSDGKKCANATSDVLECLQNENYKFNFNDTVLTSAESNLNYEVLTKICSNLAVDISSLDTKKASLDSIVLERRNDVAHGDKVFADYDYGIEVCNHVIDFMQAFKTLLQNHISTKAYRK